MGGWGPQENASVHNPGTEPIETALGLTPALGDSGSRFFGDIQDLVDFG